MKVENITPGALITCVCGNPVPVTGYLCKHNYLCNYGSKTEITQVT